MIFDVLLKFHVDRTFIQFAYKDSLTRRMFCDLWRSVKITYFQSVHLQGQSHKTDDLWFVTIS